MRGDPELPRGAPRTVAVDLSLQTGIPIEIDDGIGLGTMVSLRLKDIEVGDALTLVAEQTKTKLLYVGDRVILSARLNELPPLDP